jgi:hypothetical protein
VTEKSQIPRRAADKNGHSALRGYFAVISLNRRRFSAE